MNKLIGLTFFAWSGIANAGNVKVGELPMIDTLINHCGELTEFSVETRQFYTQKEKLMALGLAASLTPALTPSQVELLSTKLEPIGSVASATPKEVPEYKLEGCVKAISLQLQK